MFVEKGGQGSGNFGHAGRPGEVGGSGEGMEGGSFFHGTKAENIQNILKQGLVPKGGKGKGTFISAGPKGLLTGERGKSVFMASTFDEANSWAYHATNGDKPMVVFKVKVPKGEEIKRDNTESSQENFYRIGKIPKEWITGYSIREPMKDWKHFKVNGQPDIKAIGEDGFQILFAPVAFEDNTEIEGELV
jgi:hypothetical protein